ncbi:hypothetical protein OG785_34935 [Streptomyces sp. NBC_00006]|uniref:hypothetical protein n=1 Tax=Streptomyces sp. NBC_00006 TaxID=2975619 RepID=UPI00224EAB6A|nr:hypothetical protein [Streptomyces sp. NBC_00006]MCX5535739.1 hypothetical protein [Streptomyces sp. NBC_00006]
MLTARRVAVGVVVMVFTGAAMAAMPGAAVAGDETDYFAEAPCAHGECAPKAKSVRKTQPKQPTGARRAPGSADVGRSSSRDYTRQPKGGAPAGTPTVESSGCEYSPGGLCVLPQFDAGDADPDAEAEAKPGGEEDAVPIEVVVQQAVSKLKLTHPEIRTSPDESFVQIVHVPTWMWVEHKQWKPIKASASVEGLTVTATARPRRTVWSMGDGARVECAGSGTAYSEAYAPKSPSPDCGHVYERASVPGPAFVLSVRVVWDVTWHGGGQGGTVPGLVMDAHREVVVDEVQGVVTS